MTGEKVESSAVPAVALALVSGATALAFGRIFSDAGFVPLVMAAALIPHGIGWLGRCRRWGTGRTALAGVATTTIVLTWIVAGATTAYGLPLAGTATRVGHLLDRGWQIFRTGVAPVPPTTGVVLLCAIAMMVGAVSADTIARRPAVTIGALAPTLVLFVLTGTLGTQDLRLVTTSTYVAAALVALVIANSRRLVARRTWFTGRRVASDAAVVRSAAVVGGIALVSGLVLTSFIPGVDSPALLRYRGGIGSGPGAGLSDYSTVSPLVDLRARLTDRVETELFRVDAPQPLYWRLVALDRFDGSVWSVASEARDAATVFEPGSTDGTVRQRFRIGALGDQWVPAAFSAVGTTIGNARVIPESSTLIAPRSIAGEGYDVQSRIPVAPTAVEAARTKRPVPDALTPYLELPDDFPTALHDQARAITAGAETPYAAAQALQSFFTGGSFTYDLGVDFTDSTEAIGAFLRIKRGFCQQFAGAFAALARSVGLPSRVVVGFTPGTIDAASGDYVVRGRDAHAWVEVHLTGLGWRTFEPTPAGPLPGQAVALGASTDPTNSPSAPTPTATSTPTPTTTNPGASSGTTQTRRGETLISTQASKAGTWDIRSVGVIAAPALALLAAVGVVIARLVRRLRLRARRRHAAEPADRISGAWSEALDACATAGLPVSKSLTPWEQVQTMRAHGAPADSLAPLRDLADLYTETEYSDHSPTVEDEIRAWSETDKVRAALLVGVGPRERTRRLVQSTAGFQRAPTEPPS